MKQFKSCMVSILISFLVIVGIVVVLIAGFFSYNWVVTDETASIRGEGSILLWNDVCYREASSDLPYQKGRLLAKTSDGDYIYSVVGAKKQNFVVLTEAGFLGPSCYDLLMIREDYPATAKEVTKVQDSKNSELCRIMKEILVGDSEVFSDTLTGDEPWMKIAIHYDDCPIGFPTIIGYVQEQYVIFERNYWIDWGSIYNKKVAVRCKVIDEKYLPILRKHLGGVLDAAVAEAKVREEQTTSP